MKSSPSSGQELTVALIKTLQGGFAIHRGKISKGEMIFEHPLVQALHLAIKAFNKAPSPETFSQIVTAVKNCEQEEISPYNYAEINQSIENISTLLGLSQRKTSLRK